MSFDVRDLTRTNFASRAWLLSRSEAASVTLWRFHKAPKTKGTLLVAHPEGGVFQDELNVEVVWDEPTRDLLESLQNMLKNTERAAEALAIALANHLGFTVVGEAFHGSGADLLMVRRGEPETDLYKFEVSGMADINAENPADRLQKKVDQALRGELERPGMAVVVRFADVRILVEAWQ